MSFAAPPAALTPFFSPELRQAADRHRVSLMEAAAFHRLGVSILWVARTRRNSDEPLRMRDRSPGDRSLAVVGAPGRRWLSAARGDARIEIRPSRRRS